ncbi:hypothetical protein EDB83DRAFT_2225783, partial [Lactarius deliciosus]
NCFVLGEDRNNISVKIPNTKNVSTLRQAIKEKNAIHHVDANTLALWRVSIPDDNNLELKLSELDLVDVVSEARRLARRCRFAVSTTTTLNV